MSEAKKGILFFDIDGTLVDSFHGKTMPDPAVIEGLQQARRNGWILMISSGRNLGGVEKYLDLMDGAVFADGAGVLFHGQEPILRPIPAGMPERILSEVIHDYHGSATFAGLINMYASREQMEGFIRMASEKDSSYEAVQKELEAIHICPMDSWHGEAVLEMDLAFPNVEAERKWASHLPSSLHFISTSASYGRDEHASGEVTAAGVTKGSGARKAAQILGIPMENTYAFGDSMNDETIIETCGHGIAMGNAVDQLKKKADYVTGDISEGGLLQAIRHYGII